MNRLKLKPFFNLIFVTIGIAGLRIDRFTIQQLKQYKLLSIIWIAGFIATTILAWVIARHFYLTGALIYFTIAWIFYYVGNTFILKTKFRFLIIKKYGEEKAYRIYEVIVGLMFANQALAFGALVEERWLRWPQFVHHNILDEAGLLLIGAGFIIKIWATAIIGLDTYYFKDMFLSKASGSFAESGPYKLFNNPIYGVGNLQLYGLALFHFSVAGLAAAVIYQLSIYMFYYFAERPAIRRIYERTIQ